MAKKPGPVAGSLGNTEYYYKSDGTVVDEAGVPASARITAMFGPPPVVEQIAKARAPKKLKKNNAQLAGVFSDTKYFYTPDGGVVDESGAPAPEKFAKMFPPHEKREAIAAAMPVAPGKKRAVAEKSGIPNKVIKEFNKNIAISTNLITSNQKITQAYPKLFEQLSNVVMKMTEHNETVIRSVIENNQAFQDKVLETLTGVKTPTQAGGAVRASPGRKGAGRRAGRAGRTTAVLARAKRIAAASTQRKVNIGIGVGLAAGAIAGVVSATSSSPGGATGAPGGSASGAAPPPGGMWPNTPASGNNKQILETIKKRESGGNYNIRSNSSSASGAYQFIDSTWRSRAQAAGVDTQKYPRAFMAPPEVQDKVADVYISEVLRQNNNDVSKIPLVWYTGNAQGRMSAQALAVNRGLTPQAYQASWMKTYQQMGGSVQTASTQQSTPSAPAPTPAPAGTPTRTPSATPEEAAQHQADINQLKEINDLLRRKGPGAQLGETYQAKKQEIQTRVQAFNQKFSIAPMQEAGTVRPLDTSGAGAPTGGATLPSGDIVALGRALQGMGINVSEHPAFGRVGVHAPGSAHYSGRAIDVNGPPGLVEANDPVWGPKFDALAASMRAAGYKVIWRSAGHYNHLHAQIDSAPGGSTTPVPGAPSPGGSYAGGAGPQMAAASQGYAMNRVAAACECAPTIINRTVTNDMTRIITQSAGPQFAPAYNPDAYMIGAGIGSILRKIF